MERLKTLQERLARVTRVITYNRAGYGRSDPGLLPRDSGREAEELRALLKKASVAEPFVLVGHSLGALNAQVFASKYPKAVECLRADEEPLLTHFDFPAEHWKHLRTTNPIESTFATVRLRHRRTKGSGSRDACLAMVYKLAEHVYVGLSAGYWLIYVLFFDVKPMLFDAWFEKTTNYDLALVRWLYEASAELAAELVRLKVDVIVTITHRVTLVAREATPSSQRPSACSKSIVMMCRLTAIIATIMMLALAVCR